MKSVAKCLSDVWSGISAYSNTSKLAIFGALKIANSRIWMLVKGTASLEVKSSERNRELENFASLEPRVCEVLLYLGLALADQQTSSR